MNGWFAGPRDAAEGDVVTFDAARAMCFAEGTLIRTPDGERPVERLRAGDLVVTPGGSAPAAPLHRVGSLHIDLARHDDRASVAPVTIKAGALAEGIPFRDLHVSPGHGILFDGRPVAARLLLNGITIVQQTWLREVTYHHLGLASHEMVVSEGALTASHIEDGNRLLFGDPGGITLGPDLRSGREEEDAVPAPVEGGPALAVIRQRIGARAGFLQDRRQRA